MSTLYWSGYERRHCQATSGGIVRLREEAYLLGSIVHEPLDCLLNQIINRCLHPICGGFQFIQCNLI